MVPACTAYKGWFLPQFAITRDQIPPAGGLGGDLYRHKPHRYAVLADIHEKTYPKKRLRGDKLVGIHVTLSPMDSRLKHAGMTLKTPLVLVTLYRLESAIAGS